MGRQRTSWIAAYAICLIVVCVLAGLTVSAREHTAPARSPTPAAAPDAATEAEARAICSVCHLFPPAEILPRYAWRDEIARMSLIRSNQPQPAGPAGTAGRIMLLPPDMDRVLRYYERLAPEKLPAPAPWPAAVTGTFVKRVMNPAEPPPGPAVANVRLLDVDGDGLLELLVSEMRYGLMMMGKPYTQNPKLDVIAQLNNPCHISMVDFDHDGIQDFLVGDLGEFLPADHTRGSVVLLHGTKEGKYEQLALDGWPRVADVEAADFNGDGTSDLAVAAFGWRKVGNLSVLENHTTDYTHPSFVPRLIDPRPGAINAIPVDLNKDGKQDLVVIFAQQFESVVAFLNNGGSDVSFTPQVLYTGPHPNWGSSGIQVVDLDGDGDLDVLLTHGDTFDDQIIKPYHGIQWLENRGSYPFVEHTLADLPGVSRAQAVDLDGDGDLDIVASAFIAGGSDVDVNSLPSLVWLEQTTRGVFVKHTLEMGHPFHATLDVGDFDHDGDIDIVTGNFLIQPKTVDWVEVWENHRLNPAGSTR
jgi:VCBS repeat protein